MGWLLMYGVLEALAVLFTLRALRLRSSLAAWTMLTFAEFIPGAALSDQRVASIVRLPGAWSSITPGFFYVLTLGTMAFIGLHLRRRQPSS